MPAANQSRSALPGVLLLLQPLILLAVAAPLQADTLILGDGSRLQGEVVRQKDGMLEFRTGFAGVINVQWDQVSELHAGKPVEVYLDSKASLQATTITNSDDATVIESAGGPDRRVAPQAVVSINPEPWEHGEGYKLSGLVNAGLEFRQGNSDQEKLALDGAVKVRRQHDRLKLEAQYQRDKSSGLVSAENWFLRNKYDYFVTDRRYYGVSLNFEHDRFADLKLRSSLGPHVGYQFFESKAMNLSADLSPLYVNEAYYVAPDDEYSALGWSIDFDRLLLAGRMQFYHRQNGLFETGDAGNVVVDTWTGFRFPLVAGVLASLEAQVTYDGGVPPGIDEVDAVYRAKLGYQW